VVQSRKITGTVKKMATGATWDSRVTWDKIPGVVVGSKFVVLLVQFQGMLLLIN